MEPAPRDILLMGMVIARKGEVISWEEVQRRTARAMAQAPRKPAGKKLS